jgi:hypothetical protein
MSAGASTTRVLGAHRVSTLCRFTGARPCRTRKVPLLCHSKGSTVTQHDRVLNFTLLVLTLSFMLLVIGFVLAHGAVG